MKGATNLNPPEDFTFFFFSDIWNITDPHILSLKS